MPIEFRADLHIHTCLSPCADIGMTPLRIIEKAASLGLNIIAISDHNSVENAEVARRLGMKKGINAILGMEITSSEEVPVLGLFRHIEDAWKMQNIVYENLQPGENDENAFGMQVVVNEEEEVLGFNRRLLIGATRLSVNNLVEAIHSFNGIAIAAHIDRRPLGNMADTILVLIAGNPDIDFYYKHKKNDTAYSLDTKEIRAELGDVPLNSPEVIEIIRKDIEEGLMEIKG